MVAIGYKVKGWGIVALAGAGAALAVLSTPVGLLEMLVASAGISEALPATAPPLGVKARLLLALFAALMAAGAAAMVRRETDQHHSNDRYSNDRREKSVRGASIMGFAFSKLAAIARRSVSPLDRVDAPPLRRADAHPDAPARSPIFASRDFSGLDIFSRPETGRTEPGRPDAGRHEVLVDLLVEPEPEQDPIVPATGLAMPSAPLPLSEAELRAPSFARAADPANDHMPVTPPAPRPISAAAELLATPAFAPRAESPALSVRELAERLERGLAARAQIVATPVVATPVVEQPAAPVVPPVRAPIPTRLIDMPTPTPAAVRRAVEPDVDEALRAALGTLRLMTARAR